MNYEEAQGYLTEARDCINNLSPNFSSAGDSLLNSIACSLLVIASVVADIEFKDEEDKIEE